MIGGVAWGGWPHKPLKNRGITWRPGLVAVGTGVAAVFVSTSGRRRPERGKGQTPFDIAGSAGRRNQRTNEE
jgi:hypothetical protein